MDESEDEYIQKPVDKPAAKSADTNGSFISKDNVLSDPEHNTNKRRLRPRKRKNTETETIEDDVQSVAKKPRITKAAKSKNTEQAPASTEAQPTAKKSRGIKAARPKNAATKTTASSRAADEPLENEEASAEADVAKKTQVNGDEWTAVTAKTGEEES